MFLIHLSLNHQKRLLGCYLMLRGFSSIFPLLERRGHIWVGGELSRAPRGFIGFDLKMHFCEI